MRSEDRRHRGGKAIAVRAKADRCSGKTGHFAVFKTECIVRIRSEKLWQFSIQLTEVEAGFKNLKDDLTLRPIYHQLEQRIEAHIFISFLAYWLHVTLRRHLRDLAPGLTPRSVLERQQWKSLRLCRSSSRRQA
jgi:hypothetical protein